MIENTENPGDFDEFGESPELIDEDEDEAYEPEDIPIYPQELVVFPFENMKLRITDPVALQMFDEAKIDEEKVVGITYKSPETEGLPPPGSIGVAAYVNKFMKIGPNLGFVEIGGVLRYEIDEYLETDKPYPVARVNYFDDDKETEAEAFKEKLVRDLHATLQRIVDNSPSAKNRFHLDNVFTPAKAEMYSFLFWWWHKLKADVRLFFLEMRSTHTRLYLLIDALERGITDSDNKKRARNN
jgi:Lon protease-like protein